MTRFQVLIFSSRYDLGSNLGVDLVCDDLSVDLGDDPGFVFVSDLSGDLGVTSDPAIGYDLFNILCSSFFAKVILGSHFWNKDILDSSLLF